MQIASHSEDSADDTDAQTTEDPGRYDPPAPPIAPARDPELDDHCNERGCWSTEGLRLLDPDTNADPVTLCRQCWKLYFEVSS